MKFSHQLALLSLTFLAIPWAGGEFLRANEKSLVQLQEQSIRIAAQSIADGLSGQANLLYPDTKRATDPFDDQSLQVLPVTGTPVLDGYFDDWPDLSWRRFGTDRRHLDVRLGQQAKRLFVAIKLRDESKTYDQSGPGRAPVGDRLVLVTWLENRRQEYVISTSAPGQVTATIVGRRLRSAQPEAVTGHWADVGDGYQLELDLPMALTGDRLGIYYIDADFGGISTRGNIDPLDTRAPPWLVTGNTALDEWISRYRDRGIDIQILDRWGWPLAAIKSARKPTEGTGFRLSQWLYEQILENPTITPPPEVLPTGQINGPSIVTAQHGIEGARIFESEDGLHSRFTTPINGPMGIMGIVVSDLPRDRFLSLGVPAFQQLLVSGMGALALCYMALLVFAMVLSGRIKRLSLSVQTLKPGEDELPVDAFGDELSLLTRAFNAQLDRQKQLKDYLRALPQSLAHEIRTPIAIIRSALALLAETDHASSERKEIIARAGSGIERLTRLLSNMNEANQLEQIVGREPKQRIDLVGLLDELVIAYGSTFPDWKFARKSTSDRADTRVSPDLIAQAFDKLVANAASFTQTGETIVLKIERRGLWWRLTVSNPGPNLPSETHKLFSPMVSLREPGQKQEGSLGLGLYVVGLIAEHHGGEPWAQNLAHGEGVEIGFSVRAE